MPPVVYYIMECIDCGCTCSIPCEYITELITKGKIKETASLMTCDCGGNLISCPKGPDDYNEDLSVLKRIEMDDAMYDEKFEPRIDSVIEGI